MEIKDDDYDTKFHQAWVKEFGEARTEVMSVQEFENYMEKVMEFNYDN